MIIVGLDCATNHRKVGLALGSYSSKLAVLDARVARSQVDIASTIIEWLSRHSDAVLAIDAPLGWPRALAPALAKHVAGGSMPEDSHSLFRRETDREIKRRLGQQPLDVGADRIARTAHAALKLLASVRAELSLDMGWTPGAVVGRQAIEVYPAATLKALGLETRGYKGNAAGDARTVLLDSMSTLSLPPAIRANALASDHIFDAIVCTCAGADYLTGNVVSPLDLDLARQEGWIWARSATPTTER